MNEPNPDKPEPKTFSRAKAQKSKERKNTQAENKILGIIMGVCFSFALFATLREQLPF